MGAPDPVNYEVFGQMDGASGPPLPYKPSILTSFAVIDSQLHRVGAKAPSTRFRNLINPVFVNQIFLDHILLTRPFVNQNPLDNILLTEFLGRQRRPMVARSAARRRRRWSRRRREAPPRPSVRRCAPTCCKARSENNTKSRGTQ